MINYYSTLWYNDAQRDNCNMQNCLLQHLSGSAVLCFQFWFVTLIGSLFPSATEVTTQYCRSQLVILTTDSNSVSSPKRASSALKASISPQ